MQPDNGKDGGLYVDTSMSTWDLAARQSHLEELEGTVMELSRKMSSTDAAGFQQTLESLVFNVFIVITESMCLKHGSTQALLPEPSSCGFKTTKVQSRKLSRDIKHLRFYLNAISVRLTDLDPLQQNGSSTLDHTNTNASEVTCTDIKDITYEITLCLYIQLVNVSQIHRRYQQHVTEDALLVLPW